MKRILLPTDFSENARHAINYAIELFDKHFCEFYILNAYAPTDNKLKSLINKKLYPKQFKELKERSEYGLKDILEILSIKESPYHRFKTLSVEGNALEVIQNSVDRENIDLIIMGSQGVTRSRKVAFGTVAIYIMEKVRNCPSIIVPETANYKKPKEIVFPTGYRDRFNEKEIKHLINIVKIANANIAVLHISKKEVLDEQQQKFRDTLESLFNEYHHSFHHLTHDSVLEGIQLFAESRKSDMIAFINKKHVFFDNVLVQPLVKGLSFYSKIPLLVLHDVKI